MGSELKKWIKYYTDWGIKIFPLVHNTKDRQVLSSWLKEATDNYEEALKIFHENDNIGMRTGIENVAESYEPNKFEVLDLDVEKDEHGNIVLEDGKPIQKGLINFCEKFGITDGLDNPLFNTRVAKTRSGGYHIFYHPIKGKEPLRQKIGKIPGVDFKSWHNYVVAPPSTVEGGKYEVIKDVPFSDLMELPLEFYNFFAGKTEEDEPPDDDFESDFKFDDAKISELVATIADIFQPQNTGIGNELAMSVIGVLAYHHFLKEKTIAILSKAANINHYRKDDWKGIVENTYSRFKDKNEKNKVYGLPYLKKLLAQNKALWANYDEIIKNLDELFPENLYGIADKIYELSRTGPRKVMLEILKSEHIITKSDNSTDLEEIYIYNDGFYCRGEEELKKKIAKIFNDSWKKAYDLIERIDAKMDQLNAQTQKDIYEAKAKLKVRIDKGPTRNEINETLAQIRIETYMPLEKFNPVTHIPFLNGFLNIKTWDLEEKTPELAYLWRVEANIDKDRIDSINLEDAPVFSNFINSTFEEKDIPLILEYFGYSLYPGFPRQMVLFLTGKERVGKGSLARLLEKLNPHGFGSISLEKLIKDGNQFPFQGVAGKNLLVDMEIQRYRKRGIVVDYRNINKLFGGDVLDLEQKGKSPIDYISKAKGMFIGNLPLPKVTDEPFLARALLVKTKDHKIAKKDRIANLEDVLFEERDEIATILIHYLKELSSNNWNFTNEMSTDETAELWDLLSNIVKFYIEDKIEDNPSGKIPVNDVYDSFKAWCISKGIPVMAQQTFTKEFGKEYKKKRDGGKIKRYYVFTGCEFSDEGGNESNPGSTDDGNSGDSGAAPPKTFKGNYKNEDTAPPEQTEAKSKSQELHGESYKASVSELNSLLSSFPANETSNVERYLLSSMAKEEYDNFIKSLLKEGKIKQDGKTYNKTIKYRKSVEPLNTEYYDYFKFGDYNYYAFNLLFIDLNSTEWNREVMKSQEISSKEFFEFRKMAVDETGYKMIIAMEEIPAFSQPGRNYYIHKGDHLKVPEAVANLLERKKLVVVKKEEVIKND